MPQKVGFAPRREIRRFQRRLITQRRFMLGRHGISRRFRAVRSRQRAMSTARRDFSYSESFDAYVSPCRHELYFIFAP